jgi:hypothetical protein
VFAKINTSTDVLKIGILVVILDHLYSSLLNTDNNSTTGLTTDRFGGPLAVGGAIYIRVDTKSNGAFTLYSWEWIFTSQIPNNGLTSVNGNSFGCNAADKTFLEFNILYLIELTIVV